MGKLDKRNERNLSVIVFNSRYIILSESTLNKSMYNRRFANTTSTKNSDPIVGSLLRHSAALQLQFLYMHIPYILLNFTKFQFSWTNLYLSLMDIDNICLNSCKQMISADHFWFGPLHGLLVLWGWFLLWGIELQVAFQPDCRSFFR